MLKSYYVLCSTRVSYGNCTVSTKFQVVIPQKVRKNLGIKPGQKLHVIAYEDQVVLIPMRPIIEARGSLKGMDTDIAREDVDCL